MKKILLFISLFFISFTGSTYADGPSVVPWNKCVSSGDVATLSCIPIVLQNIINFLALFAGVVAVLLIIYAGIKFITSQGDPEKVATARRIMTFVLFGAVIIVASLFIVNVIAVITGVDSLKPK